MGVLRLKAQQCRSSTNENPGYMSRQERTGDFPDKLQEVTVELSDQASCAANYRQLAGVDIGQYPRISILVILQGYQYAWFFTIHSIIIILSDPPILKLGS